MNLKPIIVALVGVGVVGSAFAATNNTTASAVNQKQAIQGNSVMPVTATRFNSGLWIAGLANLDVAWTHKGSNRESLIQQSAGKSNSQIYINNANLFTGFNHSIVHAVVNARFDGRPGATGGNDRDVLGLDEAYVSLYKTGNPFYMKAGKFYNSFGSYDPYAMFYTAQQAASQVNGTGVELGAVTGTGIFANASIYSPNAQASTGINNINSRNIDNFSFNAGYNGTVGSTQAMFKVGYLTDVGSTYVDEGLGASSVTNNHAAGAFSVNAKAVMNNFNVGVNFLYALGRNLLVTEKNTDGKGKGAWFLGFNGAYKFNEWRPSSFGLGFDMASNSITKNIDTSGVFSQSDVAKYRISANYSTQINKYLGAQVLYLYNRFETATDKSANTLAGRISVNF